MEQIKLDPRKLLGFKIIADVETTAALHSPKIGGKSCTVSSDERVPVRSASLRAKIGTKAG